MPERQRGSVDERLRATPAAVASDARERVAPVTAGALLPLGETDPHGADEAVLVEVQDDPRACPPRGGKGPPAERRVEVVSVDDAGPMRADRVGHLSRLQSPAKESQCRCRRPKLRRVAC